MAAGILVLRMVGDVVFVVCVVEEERGPAEVMSGSFWKVQGVRAGCPLTLCAPLYQHAVGTNFGS